MLTVGSAGINVDKTKWSNETNRLKGRTSEVLNTNAQIDNISSDLRNIFLKHQFDKDLTLDKIKSIYLGKNKECTTFLDFYGKYLEDIKAQIGKGKTLATYHKYSAAGKHFENFLKLMVVYTMEDMGLPFPGPKFFETFPSYQTLPDT